MKRKLKPYKKTPVIKPNFKRIQNATPRADLSAAGDDITTPRSRPVDLHRIEAVVVVILTQRCEDEMGEAIVQRFRSMLEAKNLLGHMVSDTDVFDMTLSPFLYDSHTDSVPSIDAMRPQAPGADGTAGSSPGSAP